MSAAPVMAEKKTRQPSLIITFGDKPTFYINAANLFDEQRIERVARRFVPKLLKFWRRHGGASR